MIALLDHEIIDTAVQINLELPSEHLTMVGDRVALQQALINLVANAVQAMAASPPGQRLLSVAARRDGVWSVIDVRDTGPGVPDEHLDKLFDPFFTTKADGVGIGLAVSRSAVEAMGGRLLVRNAVSGGAIFECWIPLGAAR